MQLYKRGQKVVYILPSHLPRAYNRFIAMSHNTDFSASAISRIQYAVFCLWILSIFLILYGSLTPDIALDTGMQNSDKVLHALAYSWLAVGARLSFVPSSKAVWLGIGLFGLGAVVECLQSTIPSRFLSAADMLSNTLGIVFGLFLAAILGRKGSKSIRSLIK
jgi:VanZ family protein